MKLARLALAPWLLLSSALMAAPVLLDRGVAIVNNDVITQSELDQLISNVKRNARKSGQSLPGDSEIQAQVLDQLINESLQLQLAEKLGMHVSDSQLESAINGILEGENKSREQLLKELAEAGSSYSEFRQQVRNEMLVSEIRRHQVQRRIKVSQQEIDALLEKIEAQGREMLRYRIGHILIKTDETNPGEAEQQAQQLTSAIRQGDDFHKLALSHSQGPKALQGGDWGSMGINEMPTLFAEVVEGKSKGEVIGPFRSGRGLHIIKILDIEGEQKVETVEVNAQHILVKPSIILSEQRAEAMLKEIRADILAGKGDFADYARQHSEDPGSAVKGGELGWADPNVFTPSFRDTALRLNAGEISQPFRSNFGWHIMKMLDKRTTDTTEQANEQRAQQLIYQRKFNDEAQSWLNELREDAYIEIISGDPS